VDDGLLILDLFNPSLDAIVNGPLGEELELEPEFSTPDERRVIRRDKAVAEIGSTGQSARADLLRHPPGWP